MHPANFNLIAAFFLSLRRHHRYGSRSLFGKMDINQLQYALRTLLRQVRRQEEIEIRRFRVRTAIRLGA